MVLNLLALIAIEIGLMLLGRLFAPRAKRRLPSPFDSPVASDGKTIPVVFGVGQVPLNVQLLRDIQQKPSNSRAWTFYFAKMQLSACYGPLDVLYDFICDERSLALQPPGPLQSISHTKTLIIDPALPLYRNGSVGPVTLDINARAMFGNDTAEGGLQGIMRWYWGTTDQPIDPLVQYANGDFASAYPWLAHACFGTDVKAPPTTLSGDTGHDVTLSAVFPFVDGAGFQWLVYQAPNVRLSDIRAYKNDSTLLLPYPGVAGIYDYKVEPVDGQFVFYAHKTNDLSPGDKISVVYKYAIDISEQDDNFYWVANTGAPKPISALVGRYPNALLGPGTGRIGIGGNGIEFIYECYTNKVWGKGEPTTKFDSTWVDAAAIIAKEGIPLSATLLDARQINDFISDLLTHMQAVINPDPVTGLLGIVLARNDYTPSSVLTVSRTNASKPRHGKTSLAKTVNEVVVKFQRFYGGVSGVITEEVVNESIQFIHFPHAFYYQSGGRDITEVHAYANGVELTVNVSYFFEQDTGLFSFFEVGGLVTGDRVTISYVSNPKFAGFVDATTPAQNNANRLLLGRTVREEYDYPYYIEPVGPAAKAKELIKIVSRQLDGWSWVQKRDGSTLREGKVVHLLDTGWKIDKYVRLTKVGIGSREKPGVICEGIEDIYGEELGVSLSDIIGGGGGPIATTPAPPTVIACAGGGFRIGLFPVDPAFPIELRMSPSGFAVDAITVSPPGGIIYAPLTPYFDYLNLGVPFADGTVRYFQARSMAASGHTVGPWTAWLRCVAGGTPSPTPTCVTTTWTPVSSQTADTGTLLLDPFNDPQGRKISVEFKTKVGTAPESGYTLVAAAPYTFDVPITPSGVSLITARVTWIGCDGLTVVDEQTYSFSIADTPPTVSDAPSGLIIVPFHTTLTHGAVIEGLDTDWAELDIYSRRRVDTTQCGQYRVVGRVARPLPAGAQYTAQYVTADNISPVESDWKFLDQPGLGLMPVDLATDIPIASDWTALDILARQDIVIRAAARGGDGVTVLGLEDAEVHFNGIPADPVPTDGGNPPVVGCLSTDTLPVTDGLVMWLLAGCKYSGSGVLPAVEQWGDARGAEWDGTQVYHLAGLAAQVVATDLNGRNTIDFDGAVYPLEFKFGGSFYDPFIDSVSGDVFLVVKYVSGAGDLWHANQDNVMSHLAPAGINEGFGSTVDNICGAPVVSLSTLYHLYRVQTTNAVFRVWLDGRLQYQTSINEVSWPPKPLLGGGSSSWTLFGTHLRYAELALFNRALTDAEATQVGEAIKARWNLDVQTGITPPPDPPPPPPAPGTGLRGLFLWGMTRDVRATFTPITDACLATLDPSNILAEMAIYRTNGWKLLLTPVSRTDGTDAAGVPGGRLYNQAKFLARLSAWTAAGDLSSWTDVLAGIVLIDEPQLVDHWGIAIPFSVVDRVLAKRAREIFPGFDVMVRVPATKVESQIGRPVYITSCGLQWAKGGTGASLAAFMASERAAANRIGVGYNWAINPVPVSGINSSAAQVRADGLLMAADPNARNIQIWAGNPARRDAKSLLITTAAMQAAWAAIKAAL